MSKKKKAEAAATDQPAQTVATVEKIEPAATLPPVVYSIRDSAIAELRAKYSGMQIINHDNAQYLAVRAARLDCKRIRVEIEKTRKDLKADALEYGRKVDAEAARLIAQVEPIESELSKVESEHEAYVAEQKAAADRAKAARVDAMAAKLHAVGAIPMPSVLAVISDADFELMLAQATEAWQLKKRAEAEAAAAAEETRKANEAKANLIFQRSARLQSLPFAIRLDRDLSDYSEDEFNAAISDATTAFEAARKKQREAELQAAELVALIGRRVDALKVVGAWHDPQKLGAMTDAEFEQLLQAAQTEFQAAQAEKKRLADQAAELERQQKELQAAQDKAKADAEAAERAEAEAKAAAEAQARALRIAPEIERLREYAARLQAVELPESIVELSERLQAAQSLLDSAVEILTSEAQ